MICDEELCRQIQAGDEAAMEALVHRYHRPVFAYLYRLLGHRSAAEDLTQETFTRLISRIGHYRFPQPFKPWLYTIAHNLYKDYCKQSANRSTRPTAEPISPNVAEPYDISERIADRAEVIDAVRTLDPALQEVLLLRYYHDLKVDEIAAVVGAPSGTVKFRLFNSLQKLRRLLLGEGRQELEASGRRNRSGY